MRSILMALCVSVLAVAVVPAQAQAQGRTIVIDLASLGPPQKLPPPSSVPIAQATPRPLGPEILIVPPPPTPQPIIQRAPPAPPPQNFVPGSTAPQSSGFNPVDCCADGTRLWIDVEYLLGWIRSQPRPPLVANGSNVIFGGGGINGGTRSGARITAGLWLDECHLAGFQASYFFLGSQDTTQTFSSITSPALGRPFIDGATGRSALAPLLTPGTISGAYTVQATSEGLYGFNALFRQNCFAAGQRSEATWVRCDLAFGYAYLNLREGLTVQESRVSAEGARSAAFDSFQTRSEFHGAQIGLMGETRRCDVTFQAEALLALGASFHEAKVQGAALLAQATNRGSYRRDDFAVVPQLGLKAQWHFSEYVKLSAGYQLMWWSSVARPGDQIDLGVSTGRRPVYTFRDTDVWAQGLTFGVEIAY